MILKILLIEDSAADAKLLRTMLKGSEKVQFELEHVSRLQKGIELLQAGYFDLVLLDLSLPDAQGLDTFRRLHTIHPELPIIVLTGLNDESAAVETVQAGAQDYLIKGQVEADALSRSIIYAFERNKAEQRILQLNYDLERRVMDLAEANAELNQMTLALALARDEAIQASKAKSDFVAKMSHELRTPISAVIGVLELIKVMPLAPEPKEILAMAYEASQSLLSIVNESLDYYKVESGKVDLELRDFSPIALVEGAAEVLEPAAARQKISLMTFVDPLLPTFLECDSDRLRQILVNLIANAVKFTEKGEVVVKAIMENEDADHVCVRFAVIDTGSGMSSEESVELFKPLVQLGPRKHEGSGLGLSICKRLVVDVMGGQIGVESKEGKGSTFWFSVRLKRSAGKRETIALRKASGLSQVRVLVVSNSASSREILHEYIRASGMHDGVAANVDEALNLLTRADTADEAYDAAIIDMASEPEQCLILAREIKENPSIAETKLILVSNLAEKIADEQTCRRLFAANLVKPVKLGEMLRTIAEVVGDNIQLPATSPIPVRKRTAKDCDLILVVEDDQVQREILRKQMSRAGYGVHTASSGLEAVEAACRTNYALILMDLQMPEMDGIEATRAIRLKEMSSGLRVPIIALSACAVPGIRERCLDAGMDEFLSKPVAIEQLKNIMQKWQLNRIQETVLPPSSFYSGPFSQEQEKRYLAAGNPESSADQLSELASDNDPRIRRRAAENSKLPMDCLVRLSSDPFAEVRIAVAENPATMPWLLELLLTDEDPDLRLALAENSSLSERFLQILLEDENPYVAARASETLQRLALPVSGS
ncbi:MAG: response regulator [Candidatus Obscuribacterales bacterium]|nr:response regulator [Candidatus Obscuribacterales bacterium]